MHSLLAWVLCKYKTDHVHHNQQVSELCFFRIEFIYSHRFANTARDQNSTLRAYNNANDEEKCEIKQAAPSPENNGKQRRETREERNKNIICSFFFFLSTLWPGKNELRKKLIVINFTLRLELVFRHFILWLCNGYYYFASNHLKNIYIRIYRNDCYCYSCGCCCCFFLCVSLCMRVCVWFASFFVGRN